MKLKTRVFLSLITLGAFLSPAVYAQTFSVIHSFTGSDGAYPEAGVTIRAGSLYGTTSAGGSNSAGTVYQSMPVGPNWFTLPIFSFNGSDGEVPMGRVIFGPDGHPYGTTQIGGGENAGLVFDLIPPLTICKTASCPWKQNIVYTFQGHDDGQEPSGDLVFDQQGNIYGTTFAGGNPSAGTVYELMPPIPPNNKWTKTILHNFMFSDGANPKSGVILDGNGNLFGTTSQGGSDGNNGTVFELINGTWEEKILYNFQNGNDGRSPVAGLAFDSSGNLFGATAWGGSGGGGTVFELSPQGDSWVFTLLYSFSGEVNCGPNASLDFGPDGALYGTTNCDGAHGLGNVFKLANTQNGWVYTSLYDFTGGSDGSEPVSNVAFDANGNLYGTTEYGGSSNRGVVWMIKP